MAKSCLISAIAVRRLLTWTNRTLIGVVHHVTALIFYNITRCYGKHVAVFAVAVATGDIIKYQSFIYGSFVWGIQVRYNNSNYAPNFGKVEGAYCFGVVHPSVRLLQNLLRYSIWIPHQKKIDTYFFQSGLSPFVELCPFWRVIMKFCNQDI